MMGDAQRAHGDPSTLVMVQGTHSNCGKTTIVAGLCRAIARRHPPRTVCPFKPQNLALNSAVTIDGGEIGRSQALQARACGVEPTVHMNPILLKPNAAGGGIQVIVQGQVAPAPPSTATAEEVGNHFRTVSMEGVASSFQTLQDEYEVVVVEGNGSPAEVNLRGKDLGNMAFAAHAASQWAGPAAPFVVLVGDIERGGVFAHLLGTYELFTSEEKALVRGFIINRVDMFDGGASLKGGIEELERRTSKKVLGLVPRLDSSVVGVLEDEDDLDLEDSMLSKPSQRQLPSLLRVGVFRLPRMSNHTDFDPLALQENVSLEYISLDGAVDGDAEQKIRPSFDLLIIPGTKTVRADLQQLHASGWVPHIKRHLRYGGKLLGVCGGYQMLGAAIHDPEGVEGTSGSSQGLGLFEFETSIEKGGKVLTQVSGTMRLCGQDAPICGYEIHAGRTTAPREEDAGCSVLISNLVPKTADESSKGREEKQDGVISSDSQVAGTYLHGLFDNMSALKLWLQWASSGAIGGDDDSGSSMPQISDISARREVALDRVAAAVEGAIDLDALLSL